MASRRWAPALALLAAAACARPARWSEPISGPLPVEEKPVERGRLVYLQNCYRCHQGGEGGLGPPITSHFARAVSKVEIRRGYGAMPAFDERRLSSSELDDLTAYLDALQMSEARRQ